MSKSWVGMSPVPKPQDGVTIVESASFTSRCSDVETLVQLTTEAGLSAWVDPVESFDTRRGGAIKFAPGYGGSYSLIDIPRHIVLSTERHGEISVRVNPKARPIELDVTIRRFVIDGDDVDAARSVLTRTIAALRERLNG